MLKTLIAGLTAPTLRAVYRARTEPQIRHYVHGCDHVSNVALTIAVIAVRCAQASQFELALTSSHFKRYQALSGGFLTLYFELFLQSVLIIALYCLLEMLFFPKAVPLSRDILSRRLPDYPDTLCSLCQCFGNKEDIRSARPDPPLLQDNPSSPPGFR